MAKKLPKSSFPSGHGPNDFKAFGPPAMKDGEFDSCKIADMGSFSQDDKDSNKYYCAMVVQSTINKNWYTYFEWGRVGASSPQFQMMECSSEAEAQREFATQCHEKNDKRGVWTTIAGLRTLTAKPGKDVYLVRQLTARSTGLPDAKTIKFIDSNAPVASTTATQINERKTSKTVDNYTVKLLKDLIGGTITYTRSSMADNSLPTYGAINDARTIIQEAQKRLLQVGNDLDAQIADKDLRTFSAELYRRIPKIKPVGTPDSVWILSQNNIVGWNQDLDAFESALTGEQQITTKSEADPYHGLPLEMSWIDPKSDIGKFLYSWWPNATANKHGGLGNMKIKNLWKIDRHGDDDKFIKSQNTVYEQLKGKKVSERPLFQPKERLDVDQKRREIFETTNTSFLFHGTRSCNVKGILEKSFLLPKQLVGVAINGAMFGPGLYWADDWKKSAGYTSLKGSYYGRGSGSIANRDAFMYVCDVTLGEPHVALQSHGYTDAPKGKHSVFGMGVNHPTGKGRGSVQNNEWIVFDASRVRMKYLAEFTA